MENGNIYKALCGVMSGIKAVEKDRTNPQQGYKYRGIDDVFNMLQPLLAENKVFILPNMVEKTESEKTTKAGGIMYQTEVQIEYNFYTDDGSSIKSLAYGKGMDSGDKSMDKAKSSALKYLLMQMFAIPTDDEKDTESGSPEIKSKKESGKSEFPKTIEEIKNKIASIDNLPYMKNWTAKHGKEINDLPEKAEIWALVSSKEKELSEKKNPPKENPQNSTNDFLSTLKSDLEKIPTIEAINKLYENNKPGYEKNPKFDEIKEIFISRKRDLANTLMAKNMGIEMADLVEFRKEMNGHGLDNTLIQQVIDGTKEAVNELKIRIENWKKNKAKKGDQLDMLGDGEKQHNDPM